MKRLAIHGRGRTGLITKPKSHLTVILREETPDFQPKSELKIVRMAPGEYGSSRRLRRRASFAPPEALEGAVTVDA